MENNSTLSLTAEEIASDLRKLGMPASAVAILHSSLKSLGHVHGGAETVIEAFLSVLGPEGTLVTPAFTYCFLGNTSSELFEAYQTPTVTGRIPEALRHRPGSMRSFHPTHSVVAFGPHAMDITSGHLQTTPLGRNSPVHRVALLDGWIVLLGCGHEANSFIHVAEVLSGAPYTRVFAWTHLGWRPQAQFLDPSGRIRTLAIFECPGCSKSFPKIESELNRRALLLEGRVGSARAQLARARNVADVVMDMLDQDPTFLLCPDGTCSACDVRRLALRLPTLPPVPQPHTWLLDDESRAPFPEII